METIKLLERKIKKYSEDYYNKGESQVNDDEFDALVEKLRKLDPNNKLLTTIGKDSSGDFKKCKHVLHMFSQQKAKNLEEFDTWMKKWSHLDKSEEGKKKFIVEHKLDGMSIELQYKNGKFVKGITRGDGKTGDDITVNVLKMKGVTKNIEGFTGAVRGEIVLFKDVFKKSYKTLGFKNARNTACGLAKNIRGEGCKDLTIIVYDSSMENKEEILDFLKENFEFVVEHKFFNTFGGIKKYYMGVHEKRDSLDYDIDGLVILCNVWDSKDLLRDHPEKQIALKFPPKEKITTIKNVIWSFKGSIYSPVAILDPIKISGSLVSKASLCNPGIIEDLGLRIGSKVVVVKRGEIIPKIERVIEIGEGKKIIYPKVCKICEEKLVYTKTKLYCENEECENRGIHQLKKWISTLGIKEFGNMTLESIYESKLATTISQLYKINVEDLAELKGDGGKKIGMKNATRAINNLHAINSIPLSKFIAGFDIELIGEKVVDLIKLDNLDDIFEITEEDLLKIKGIGEVKAKKIIKGLHNHKKEMLLVNKKIKIEKIKIEKIQTLKNNLTFCFTGKLDSLTRKEAEELVAKIGGKCKNTVTGVDYVVNNDTSSTSKKNIEAIKKGIKVIDEKEFLKIVNL